MSNQYRNKNVLITGGLGFLGSSIAVRLIEDGANVYIVDNLNNLYGGNLYNLNNYLPKINLTINDMRNTEIMTPLIEKADYIFHLAAQVSYIDSSNIPFEDLDLNSKATLNILECCKRVNPKVRVVFTSSRMVYGKSDQNLVTEESPTNPLSLYGIHKLTSEKYLIMYNRDFGIPTTILRVTNPYGPRQQVKHSKYSLVGWFIRQALEGKVIKIFGDGKQLRDYIFADDIVTALLMCGLAEKAVGQIINLGSGQSTRFCDMVSAVIQQAQAGSMEFVPWPDSYERVETGDISVDISKLRSITGWQPRFTLQDGIDMTCLYYRKNLEFYS
jgi:nucleoside-diphosphate-sugar epimerase